MLDAVQVLDHRDALAWPQGLLVNLPVVNTEQDSQPQGDENEVRRDRAQGGWPWSFWAADQTAGYSLRREAWH